MDVLVINLSSRSDHVMRSNILICRFKLVVAVCAGGFPCVLPAAPDDWLMYNKSFDGSRFSELAQINATNAKSIDEVCRVKVARGGSFHTGLVVVNGRMYFSNAHWTFAVDASNCALIWKTKHIPLKAEVWRTNRGIAFMGDTKGGASTFLANSRANGCCCRRARTAGLIRTCCDRG